MKFLAQWHPGPVAALVVTWIVVVVAGPMLWIQYEAAQLGRAAAAFAGQMGATESAVQIDWAMAAPLLGAFVLVVGVLPAVLLVRAWRVARR